MVDIIIYAGAKRAAAFAETNKGRAWIILNTHEHFDGGRAFTFEKKLIHDMVHLMTIADLEVHLGKTGD